SVGSAGAVGDPRVAGQFVEAHGSAGRQRVVGGEEDVQRVVDERDLLDLLLVQLVGHLDRDDDGDVEAVRDQQVVAAGRVRLDDVDVETRVGGLESGGDR